MVDVALYIRYAKVAQVKDTVKIAQQLAFNGKTTVTDYVRLLYIVRKSVEFMFANNPSDPNLENVANYMYTLSGKRSLTPSTPVSPFMIIVQPNDATVTVGLSVTFNVTAAGGQLPYSYQWQKNGTNIGGATSSSLTINPVALSDAGGFDCVVTDATGTVLTSRVANLVVNAAPLIASWWWSADTDPYPQLSSGTDNLVYLGTVPVVHTNPITIPWPSASANNTYKVVRYPIGEGIKTNWNNTVLNNGPIPGTAYHEVVVIGSFLYIISKGDSIFTPYTVTYS